MYLTPERVKTLGLGIDLDEIEVVEIRSAIARTASKIHAYCNVPKVPQGFSFRGGNVVDEAHAWVIDEYAVTAKPFRFWPLYQPVRSVSQFRIYATPDVYVGFDATKLFINNSGGYVEVSEFQLTQFGIFGAGIVPLIGIFDPVAKMSYSYGERFAIVDEQVEPVDARTYAAVNQFWSTDDVVVKVDDVVKDAADYTVDRVEGRIVFDANQPANAVVTVSYTTTLDPDVSSAAAIILGSELAEADLRRAGMGNLSRIRVNEVELQRAPVRAATGRVVIPDDAASLLEGRVFITVR
jgi:hypothetical protein